LGFPSGVYWTRVPEGFPTTICLPFADQHAMMRVSPISKVTRSGLPHVAGPAVGPEIFLPSMSAIWNPSEDTRAT
jgi:hypothetical protein